MKPLAFTTLLALVACGDGTRVSDRDAAADPDDVADPDAPPDAPPAFVAPTPFAIPLSVAGPDQLQSAAPAADGKFYAAGFAAVSVTAPRFVTVVRYNTNGTPDPTFGANGVVTTPIEFVGGGDEVDIAVQADGKVLVTGTTNSPAIPGDRDIGIARLNTNGTLDATFNAAGTIPGVAIINLNDAIMVAMTPTAPDASRGLAVDANGIYILGVSRGLGNKADASGPRTDTDFTVVRLTAAGIVDVAFGGGSASFGVTPAPAPTGIAGQFRLDISEANATARAIKVLADGKLMVGGYANTPISGNTTQPVLYKLTTAGALDTTWNDNSGIFHEVVLATQTEVYNMAVHGTNFTTAGYGRNSGTTNDFISLRFDIDTATGVTARDLSYGTNGNALFDPSGTMLGSNCRNAIALPGGKTMLTGSTGPSNQTSQDAVVAILNANGALDTTYGTGIHVYPLGANGNDQFWGGTVSGTQAIVVGYKGGLATQTDLVNDDAFAVVFDIQ